jgi:phage terminase large subunit-like protein
LCPANVSAKKPAKKKPAQGGGKAVKRGAFKPPPPPEPPQTAALHPCHQYAHDVISGKILACKKVIQSAQRHLDDLNRDDIYFDEAAANRIYTFARNLKHIKGRWDSPYIKLEPWQLFVFGCLFGWKVKATGFRRFTWAYIQVARKNGKSTMIGILALYFMLLDWEPGAEVYCAATKFQQAKIVFNSAKQMAIRNPYLKKRLAGGIFKENLYDFASASKMEPIGSDADTTDGLNPNLVIIDELHAFKDRALVDVLQEAMASREQPMQIEISTAGYHRDIGYERYEYAAKVLSGVNEHDSFFCYVAELDEDDDWQDKTVWIKANPNLGVSVKMSHLLDAYTQAKNNPAKQNSFLVKHLNKWVNSATKWIDFDVWKKSAWEIDPEILKDRPCFGGLDLSTKLDLTAFVLVFPPWGDDPKWQTLYRFWVPEEMVEKRSRGYQVSRAPYDLWVKQGHLLQTDGDVLDYDLVISEIVELSKIYDIKEIGFDPYKATVTSMELEKRDLKTVEVRQGRWTLSEPMNHFYELLLQQKINHGNHPVMTWMANNLTIKTDTNGNIQPDKEHSIDKIDGPVALFTALTRALMNPDPVSVYADRDIRMVEF